MTAEVAATIRLGVQFSLGAVALAIVLSLVGDVTQWSYVTAVAVVGSILSWNRYDSLRPATQPPG